MTGTSPAFLKSGHLGWLSIAAGVVAWDVLASDTLTESFRRAQAHPVSAVATGTAWWVLTAHLFGWLPERADPIHLGVAGARNLASRSHHK